MGDLYEKAGATGAATEAARRRLERVLVREAGLAQRVVNAGPEAVVAALEARFGGAWQSLGDHLHEASLAADTNPRTSSAFHLVRALGEDAERVRGELLPREAASISRVYGASAMEQEIPPVGANKIHVRTNG